ncbi:hypothetical protein GCM10023205_03830 [Yinghuangia aomiensis]|uniref:HTH cro/C1-type domain-containing protein n=2 Tax=Yinghuangia aomiensis TaxID=676205 RepID=A0ABP9GL90_9ACTN
MSTSEWPAAFTLAVGQEIRRVRNARGLTADELSAACAALGAEVPSRALTNLETGRRGALPVTDLLVLARALKVAPISLLFPLGGEDEVEVLPGHNVAAWDAVAWFTDEQVREDAAPISGPRAVIDRYRAHAAAVHTALVSLRIREDRRRQPGANMAYADAMLADDVRCLLEMREAMLQDGLVPAPLPPRLAAVWEHDARSDASA